MLSVSHPHPAASTGPRHRKPLSTAHHRRRRCTYTIAALILPGGGGPRGSPPNGGKLILPGSGGGGGRGGGGGGGMLPRTPPPTAPPGQLYQPFHPPPNPLPENYRNLDLTERLAVLRDRMGRWYEYAPLISSLSREGFTPASIEEATGMSGVEQNRLVVASQVRDSLISDDFPDDLLHYFDSYGGPDLLYELRFLNARQRIVATKHTIERRLESKGVRELARSMKDFPQRRGDEGWDAFDRHSAGDCLAYARFRLSREAIANEDRIPELERSLDVVETESARARVELEIEKAIKKAAGEEVEELEAEVDARPAVPVVRLMYGEISEASIVLLLPVVKETDGVKAVDLAPRRSQTDADLGIVEVDKGWARWAVLPGWAPVMAVADEAVVIELADGRVMPWRSAENERVLVVADRKRKEVVDEGIYVLEKGGKLVVERGKKLLEEGISQAAAEVVTVVRPPKDEEDIIVGDEWD
ncbi:hypothetical protein VPH35_007938 [Triticum aestivum]|uniref:Rubisco accumulation factor 1, chloroplastic n=2 Tax=Triticum TaxID=4564 RepID=A0A9R0QSV5_TRITD|nr:rubisco accumulation factor 1, chloroplastic-like [Triticum aestivum]VAH16011.1 unnamed protein product [Triticum turgidum subsp. durum]